MSVVFPAPDGPETMNNVPSGWKLLDILDLLADPLDLGFQFYNEGAQRRGARLRAHRVYFTQHFLRQKIELLARRFSTADRLLRLIYMVSEPRQLLGDVALLDHDHHFLRDAILVHVDACDLRDLLHALLIRGEQFVADLVAMRGQALLQFADRLEARDHVRAQRLPFAHAHRTHLAEGIADDDGQGLALFFRDLGLDRFDLQQVG